VDVILGQPRRNWSLAEKCAIVAETFVVGARVVDVMRRHRISSDQIHAWRNEFRVELGFPAPEKPARAGNCALWGPSKIAWPNKRTPCETIGQLHWFRGLQKPSTQRRPPLPVSQA
jgi:hypothetical protein